MQQKKNRLRERKYWKPRTGPPRTTTRGKAWFSLIAKGNSISLLEGRRDIARHNEKGEKRLGRGTCQVTPILTHRWMSSKAPAKEIPAKRTSGGKLISLSRRLNARFFGARRSRPSSSDHQNADREKKEKESGWGWRRKTKNKPHR